MRSLCSEARYTGRYTSPSKRGWRDMPGPKHGKTQGFAKPKDAKGTFRRILGYFKPYRWQLIAVFIGIVLSSGANIAGTYMLKPIINVYILPWVGSEKPD